MGDQNKTYLQGDNAYDEPKLLQLVAESDEIAFARLIDHYSSLVYGFLLKYVKDTQIARELSQDVFIKLWKHRKHLPDLENFPGYVYRTLRNTAINALKSRVLSSSIPPPEKVFNLLSDARENLEYKELAEALHRAIDRLPSRRRQVFKLSRFEGLTYDQIAEQLGIARSTVREHIIESLVFLRNYLKEHFDITISTLMMMGVGCW